MKKYSIKLTLFSAALTGLTALVNELTKNTINEKVIRQQKALFDQVISTEYYDNDIQKDCFVVYTPQLGVGAHHVFIARKGNTLVGAVMEATAHDGYSGAIQLLIATDFNGTVLGTRVTKHHETPGLGDKIELRLSDWILRFNGKVIQNKNDADFAIKKDGGEFDQFTGATITPRAVVNAVKRAGLYAKTIPEKLNTLPTCMECNHEPD